MDRFVYIISSSRPQLLKYFQCHTSQSFKRTSRSRNTNRLRSYSSPPSSPTLVYITMQNPSYLCPGSILLAKILLANCFRNFSKKDLKKTAIRNCIEEIANVSKIPKVRRIFLLCKKIAGITNFSKFYFYKEKRPWRASWSPQISQKSHK